MKSTLPKTLALLAALLLASCDYLAAEEDVDFRATVSGGLERKMRGEADFRVRSKQTFLFYRQPTTWDIDFASGGDRLYLMRGGRARPEVGRYGVGPYKNIYENDSVFTAFLILDGVPATFYATGGFVEVTRSTADVVEGLFAFTALPADTLEEPFREVTVEGSFTARPTR